MDASARRPRAVRGPLLILIATAIGGGSGYVLMLVAGVVLGAELYAPFGVFWSFLFFVVGALSGLQQEVARATSPREPGDPARPITRDVALGLAAAITVLTVATSPLWSTALFGSVGASFIVPLALGFAGYVVLASIGGTLFALNRLELVSLMIASDGLLRLLGSGIAFAVHADPAVLAWTVVAPFIIVPAGLWVFARRTFVDRTRVDVRRRQLARNAASTISGSAAAGVLISGFPAILAATSPAVDTAALGALILVMNATRAPLIVVLISLQSLLVVRFRAAVRPGRILALLCLAVAAATVLLAGAFGVVGPALMDLVFDETVAGWVIAGVVLSGGLVGILCVCGALVIAQGRHAVYTAAWALAAVVTVGLLLIPGDVEVRMLVSLLVAPAAGLALVAIAAVVRSGRQSVAPSSDAPE